MKEVALNIKTRAGQVSDQANSSTEMRTRPVYELVAEDIRALGVRTVFGLVSDDTLGLVAALDAIGVEFCSTRHETHAVLAAEGYAAGTGGLGIAIVGRGPASANAMHGIMNASKMSSRVLVITGEGEDPRNGSNGYGPDYKGYNAMAVLTAAGVRNFIPTNPASVRATFRDAIEAANTGQLVTLHLRGSVQNAELDAPAGADGGAVSPLPKAKPTGARTASIQTAVSILKNAKRPLIIAGEGAHLAGARPALDQLVSRLGALAATSLRGKDFFRGNPYAIGIVGLFSTSLARRLIEQADCVLVFGASLNFNTTSKGHAIPQVPLIHVDQNRSHIGRWHPADVALVGDARIVTEQLLAALPDQQPLDKPFHAEEVRKSISSFDLWEDFKPSHTLRTIDPRSLALELSRILPEHRNVIYDSGNFLMVAPYVSVPDPSYLKLTTEFNSMGVGLGAALGFAKARPDVPSVLFIGDGGLMMQLSELETAVRINAPLVIVAMNDCAFGAELHSARFKNLPIATSVFPDIDFAPVAEAFGYTAETVRSMQDLERISSLLNAPKGPILIDCKINAGVPAPFIAEYLGGGPAEQK
jgi:acetolactate synthase-1/2/3 large subunit